MEWDGNEDENAGDLREGGRDLGSGEPHAQSKGNGVTLCRSAINKEQISNCQPSQLAKRSKRNQ